MTDEQDRVSEADGADEFGPYLKSVRKRLKMSLRDVEEATGKEVSNAYLSQLETGKITKPSPHVLYSLSVALRLPYEDLMARVGYIVPNADRAPGEKHGRAATFASMNLTGDEEEALLGFLDLIRKKRS